MVGRLMAYDKHMNVVLEDAEEFRGTTKTTERRNVGLIMLTGRNIISMVLDSSVMEMDCDSVDDVQQKLPPRDRVPASEILMSSGGGVGIGGKLPMPGQRTTEPSFRP